MTNIERAHLIYAAAIIIRFVFVFSPGYIHPDEFFQSPEIASRDVLGLRTEVTWEFRGRYPIRSILPIWFNSGFPMWVLSKISDKSSLSGQALLISPRLFLFVLSFAFDIVVWRVCASFGMVSRRRVLTLATSWITIVFHCRTFSNSTESLLLVVCFACVLLLNRWSRTWIGFALGALFGVGAFVRFTFLALCTPLVTYFLIRTMTSSTHPRKALLSTIFAMCVGFCLSAFALLLLDTMYFRGEAWTGDVRNGDFVIAPMHAFAYNSRYENLKMHGIHFRATHALCNMPMLFGPMTFAAVWYVWCRRDEFVRRMSAFANFESQDSVFSLSVATMVMQIAVLSLAPHQEPRFLIPLLLPMTLAFGDLPFRLERRGGHLFTTCWVVFNLCLGGFFGFVHQAGVVPSLTTLSLTTIGGAPSTDEHVAVMYVKTYMPPWHLLLASHHAENSLTLVDAGFEESSCSLLEDRLPFDSLHDWLHHAHHRKLTVLIVGPENVEECMYDLASRNRAIALRRHDGDVSRCFGPHFSGEAFPKSPSDFMRGICIWDWELRAEQAPAPSRS